MNLSQIDLVNSQLTSFGIENFNLEEFIKDHTNLNKVNFSYSIFIKQESREEATEFVSQDFIINLVDKLNFIFLQCTRTLKCATIYNDSLIFPSGNTYTKILNNDIILSGSYNEISLYVKNLNNDKIYAIKKNKITDYSHIEDPHENKFLKTLELINSFYENLKHIILSIIIANTYHDLKLIPKIYDIAYILDEIEINNSVMCIVMEYDDTLINDQNLNTPNLMNKYLYSVYKELELINLIKPSIHFRHGDLKCDNLLVTKDLKPVLIDFGFSEFELDSRLKFKSQSKIINYWNYYEKFSKKNKIKIKNFGTDYFDNSLEQTLDILNSTHDMIQLLFSFYSKNLENNVLILRNPTNPTNYILSRLFIEEEELMNEFIYQDFYTLNILRYIGKYHLINSEFLLQILEVDQDKIPLNRNDLFAKYKLKYLKLKLSIK